jgi:hypothetical protein
MRFYEPVLRHRHNKHWHQFVEIIDGEVIINPRKVALLLIYQPKHLAKSILWTCSHLIEQGYAPLIVSNSELVPESLELLKSKSWKIMLRPNVGYDFGGYKDGIRYLKEANLNMDFLLVMNDSIWFPLYQSDQTLKIMEQSPEDFSGLLERQRTPKTFHFNKARASRPFLGSYFWLFKKQTLSHPAFNYFWNSYKPTSSKFHTIRNGERLLTPTLVEAGLTYQALFKMQMLANWLLQLNNQDLSAAMRQLTCHDPLNRQKLAVTIDNYSDTQAWREQAKSIIDRIAGKNNILAMAPTLTVSQFDVGYFKKGSDASGLHALKVFIEDVNAGGKLQKPHDSIWIEMLKRCI